MDQLAATEFTQKSKDIFNPDVVEKKSLFDTIKDFVEADKTEFLAKFATTEEEQAYLFAALLGFEEDINFNFDSTKPLPDDAQAEANHQHWGYAAGHIGRIMRLSGEAIIQVRQAFKDTQDETEIRQTISQYGTFPETENWVFNPVKDSMVIRKNLFGGIVLDVAFQYADHLGIDRQRLYEVLEYNQDSNPDAKIEGLLGANNESPVAKVIDLIGRLNHVAWMISTAADGSYRKKFNNEKSKDMFGTFDQMREQVCRDKNDLGLSIIAKDYDQARSAIWYNEVTTKG